MTHNNIKYIPQQFLDKFGYYIFYIEINDYIGHIGFTRNPLNVYLDDMVNNYTNINLKMVIDMSKSLINPLTVYNNIIISNNVYKKKCNYLHNTFKIKYYDNILNNIMKLNMTIYTDNIIYKTPITNNMITDSDYTDVSDDDD